MTEYSYIGKSVPRIDARRKVTGEAIYAPDVQYPGMCVGRIKRSPHPFARILSINTERARKLLGVRSVITALDVVQYPYGSIPADILPLAREYVRYIGDPIAAVAATDEDTAEEAMDLIEVEYEELTPVLDMERAMDPDAPAVHPELEEIKNNVAAHLEFVRGDGEAAFKQVDMVIEERFITQTQQHVHLEPHSCVALWDTSNKLTFWVSTQSVFRIRMLLAMALGIPEHQIQVIQTVTGGSFGSKVRHSLFPICALLAKKAGTAVKMVHTREEEFMTFGRVPEIIDLKLGFKRDGTMVAKSVKITAEAGAYIGPGHAPSVMVSSSTRSDCVYRLAHIKVVANLVYTNTTPRTCMRGYGNPQMVYAMESLVDMAAERLGIDPMEIRLKNCTQQGDVTAHGWIINSCGLSEAIQRAAENSGWKEKRQKPARHHGIGMACQVHVSGNRTAYRSMGATINVDRNGKVKVLFAGSEMGQGLVTICTQIAAEELGVGIEDVEVLPADTNYTPYCPGIGSSCGTLLGGNAVRLAAIDAKNQLFSYAAEQLATSIDDLELENGRFCVRSSPDRTIAFEAVAFDAVSNKRGEAPIIGKGGYLVPDYVIPPDKTAYGNLSAGYAFSAQVAEVSVDPDTGKVEVCNVWVGEDVGKAINPMACEGQIEGGVAQGIGYGLTETVVFDRGKVLNSNLSDYKVPTALDVPEIHSTLVESNEPEGPYGAKSIGEAVINPTAAAIANAIDHAVGVRITELPMTPEKILKALRNKQAR